MQLAALERYCEQGPAVKRDFRCYAWGGETEWQALCVDLDIAVQGASFNEVEASLATAIEMYLESVSELPSDERSGFLSRRAPWPVRVRLAGGSWLRGLFSRQRSCAFTFRPRMPATV